MVADILRAAADQAGALPTVMRLLGRYEQARRVLDHANAASSCGVLDLTPDGASLLPVAPRPLGARSARSSRALVVPARTARPRRARLSFAALDGAASAVAERLGDIARKPVLILSRSQARLHHRLAWLPLRRRHRGALQLLGRAIAGGAYRARLLRDAPTDRGIRRRGPRAARRRARSSAGVRGGATRRRRTRTGAGDGEPAGPVAASTRTSPCCSTRPAPLRRSERAWSSPTGNLAANLQMLRERFVGVHAATATRILTWPPLFHDMGLIGDLLVALYCGVPCVLMPPIAFYQRPRRWLAAIAAMALRSAGRRISATSCACGAIGGWNLSGIDLSHGRLPSAAPKSCAR